VAPLHKIPSTPDTTLATCDRVFAKFRRGELLCNINFGVHRCHFYYGHGIVYVESILISTSMHYAISLNGESSETRVGMHSKRIFLFNHRVELMLRLCRYDDPRTLKIRRYPERQ
jgi:hypothetical protein